MKTGRRPDRLIRIGTAGWAGPRAYPKARPPESSALNYYAKHFNCVEINSSFYRLHKRATYERWAAATAANFRFSVKMPRAISHESALRDCTDELNPFMGSVAGLGAKLAILLLQLPPSAEWDAAVAKRFFGRMRTSTDVPIVCEPRHASWAAASAERVLSQLGVSLVCADPSRLPRSWNLPGGIRYYRWHGSPRVYWSSYPKARLDELADQMAIERRSYSQIWCIFDNTAAGAAWDNAQNLSARAKSRTGRAP